MRTLLLVCVVLAAVAGAQDSGAVTMPALVGEALYPASRAVRGLGVPVRYRQVAVDTAEVPEFHVAGQSPAAGSEVLPESTVVLEFNCPHVLRYWEDSALPLLGDFRHQVGFYRVQKAPEPKRLVGAGYPPELLKYAFSGKAQVEALVDFDGGVLAAKLVESSGHAEADSAALDAALRASFHPAEHYDAPVRVWFPLPFHWEYKEQHEPAPAGTPRDPMLEP
ncbi:MAG: TonB family protein [bacterium]